MEYKLIMAVSGFPSLYDSNSSTYRDLNMRSDAWRQVAEMVGVPGEWLVGTPMRSGSAGNTLCPGSTRKPGSTDVSFFIWEEGSGKRKLLGSFS